MTNETKFTSGPWLVSKEYSTMLMVSGKDGSDVCEVEVFASDPDTGCFVANEEEIANANLISSAPELYQALDKILQAHYKNEQMGFGGFLDMDEADDARAALVKARGKK